MSDSALNLAESDWRDLAGDDPDRAERAFARFYQTGFPWLVSWARWLTGRCDVDDVVQETLIEFYRKRRSVDPNKNPKGLLFQRLKSAIVADYRSRQRQGHVSVDPQAIDRFAKLVEERESEAKESMTIGILGREIARLSQNDQNLLWAWVLDPTHWTQLLHDDPRTPNALKVAKHRLLNRLRDRLAPYWPTDDL